MRMNFSEKILKVFLTVLVIGFMSHGVQCQGFHARLHLGAMYYQGDLAPKPVEASFGAGQLSWGVSVGKDVAPWMSINARYMKGRLTGSDAKAKDDHRRNRNLSFASPLHEYGVYTDLKVNQLWKALDKYKVRLYVTLGFNLIHFDPKAYYEGRWIPLQPLGTEGQTLTTSTTGKYSRYNWSRPVGVVVEFDFTERISFGMDFCPRKTYTDYLDDVSTSYPDYEAMLASGNTLGARLSNRMGELNNSEPVIFPTGTSRGNPSNNDWYTHIGFYFKYRFGAKGIPNSNDTQIQSVQTPFSN